MPLTPAEPAIFRGVIALELRDGAPPQHAALVAGAAGDLVAMLGRDLAALVPGVRDCDLALLTAHFDPAEALRPGWPLHRRASELLQRAPGQAQSARMIGFGADAAGTVPMPLQCDPDLHGGGLRILPFVLHGDAARQTGDALEDVLLDRGMAAADTALALQDGLGAQVEHARYLSLHDLAAMIALQYRNSGLDALWPLLETALLQPDAEAWLDASPEPLARYGDGEVRIAMLDPAAWRSRNAAGESDCARLERGFEYFQARQRQFAAVLAAHGVPVQFVHCADGIEDCLR
ncbi:hypothetical protein [Thermomonas carbonis]|uniref:Uncharacterized protein n=1 Tax=Thermomonas carbonis TaxID=1463158 RepID=A0A7G9STB5_9GAMM|nr:hypothetical protein [Thermomonas carbonis]QNN71090.1 hypothetical protein H9L16_05855 [Thermomonas carbonis]GHC12192.1 hypothetical protein GCM10010080_29710 [Thermomonas carbonis]